MTNIVVFHAVEDTELSLGEKALDMIWVEEWRGEEVRSRLCVREVTTEKRLDMFSQIPDSFFTRIQHSTSPEGEKEHV